MGRIVDASQLCIDEGKAAWLAYLDIYILDAGGVLLCVHRTRALFRPRSLPLDVSGLKWHQVHGQLQWPLPFMRGGAM